MSQPEAYEPNPSWQFWRFLWLSEPLPKGFWLCYQHSYWEPPFTRVWFAVGKFAFHIWSK